ncbi:MAG: metal ABC transporter substrate-binding protein [Caldilineaceae bacterium]|nr:metal ABC transporter substrate-binding protein [Caldilineaceae bacterium]
MSRFLTQTMETIRCRLLCLLAVCCLGLVGCTAADGTGQLQQPPAIPDRLQVVTTVAPLADIIGNVIGDLANLQALVPPGVNSHTYEPTPSDARHLAAADLIFINGLQLEALILDLAEANVAEGVPIVALGDRVLDRSDWVFDFSFPESGGAPNPHIWLNPELVMACVEVIAEELGRADPAQAEAYAANAETYLNRLRQLDEALAEASATVPESQRQLLTYHDSWAYFGPRYGFTVTGAIQPADMAEPSAREVADLIRQVREANVPVIFGAAEFPSPVLEAIARETGARLEASLADDVLPGEPGDPEHSYIGMMLYNTRIIVAALGGDVQALDSVPLTQNQANG